MKPGWLDSQVPELSIHSMPASGNPSIGLPDKKMAQSSGKELGYPVNSSIESSR